MKSINERMNDKLIVKNVGGFKVSLPVTSLNKKGYLIKPNGVARISIGELFEMQDGLLGGFDGQGYLSPIKIEDKDMRIALGFSKEVPDRKNPDKTYIVEQKFFEKDTILEIMKIDSKLDKLLANVKKNGLLGHRNTMLNIAKENSGKVLYSSVEKIQKAFGGK